MLYFSTGDRATDHNLTRLSHLASLDRFDGDAEQMHQWLIATMESIDALPRAASRHFTGYYFLGDTHFTMSSTMRATKWRQLVEELAGHVATAHTDPTLKADRPNGPPDVSDRRETRGEQIHALCAALDASFWGGPEFDSALARIGVVAIGDIRYDVAQLKRLSARKRIPDLAAHQYEIRRLIEHIKLVADRLHHLERG